uniref:Thioredoxin domain-containing protein n=1 Tax=Cyclophora tenuis TaxID=216820 RepID=A0A7S1D9Q3_CYCTE|mmetsp:Transcript_560/g.986  ORF Transcript_560/g.986 Transcript_560/m.986 type:complete len:223 (+) Transcript_560:61-729(+)
MSVCCIGGVCIPYTAILPVILLGLKWIVEKLTSMGLLPKSIQGWLGPGTTATKSSSCCASSTTCGKSTTTKAINGETKTREATAMSSLATPENNASGTSTSSSTTTCGGGGGGAVLSIESEEDWERVVVSPEDKDVVVVVQFTAAWCKPCKEMAPLFAELAQNYPRGQFCQVDVDEFDEIASQHKIAMMPTFVVLKNQNTLDRMMGSNPSRLEQLIDMYVPK